MISGNRNEEYVYINVLITTLQKKITILEKIDQVTEEQKLLLSNADTKIENIDSTFDKKEKLIQELNQADDGFEAIYERVKGEIKANPEKYKEQIKNLQTLIKKITDMSVSLQAKEYRNKEAMEIFIEKQKIEVKTKKSSNRAAVQYYQNMANQHRGQSYFLDKKE